MYLHTIVDQSMIFPQKPNEYKYYKLKNGFIECTQSGGKMLINRINSTNPRDYLNTEYSLGNEIK